MKVGVFFFERFIETVYKKETNNEDRFKTFILFKIENYTHKNVTYIKKNAIL